MCGPACEEQQTVLLVAEKEIHVVGIHVGGIAITGQTEHFHAPGQHVIPAFGVVCRLPQDAGWVSHSSMSLGCQASARAS